MTTSMFRLPLNFKQVLALVQQLSEDEKLMLSRELEKDSREKKLTQLLEAFQTDELSLKTIDEEVEAVRTEMYEERRSR